MRYVVEARYINSQPRLRVLDADSRTVYLEWSLTKVQEMLDSGEIEQDEFLKPERYGMNLLVKNLFLLACVENMEKESACNSAMIINIGPKSLKSCNK